MSPRQEPGLTARNVVSGLFFLVALTVGGGALGLTVGVPLDKLLVVAHAAIRAAAAPPGGLTLGVAALCTIGLSGAAALGLMRW